MELMIPMKVEKGMIREEVYAIFNKLDDDATGCLEFRKLSRVAKELGVKLTDDEIMKAIDDHDMRGFGGITYDDFYHAITKKVFI